MKRILLSIVAICVGAAPAYAQTVVVTDEASLRAAITDANAALVDRIEINATGTITLTSALPQILADVDIIGPGAGTLSINGANTFRVFHIGDGTTPIAVTVQGVTVQNGAAVGGAGGSSGNGAGGGGGAGLGGGMFVDGGADVILEDVQFDANRAQGGNGGAAGGAGSSIAGGGGGGFGGNGGDGGDSGGGGGGGILLPGGTGDGGPGLPSGDGGGAGAANHTGAPGDIGSRYGGSGGGGGSGAIGISAGNGANGDFGGGGGGGGRYSSAGGADLGGQGGSGGFGAGGGGGGGHATSINPGLGGLAGFFGGDGGNGIANRSGGGGGGAGLGGGLFVGEFASVLIRDSGVADNNAATGGAGGVGDGGVGQDGANGQGLGPAIFLMDGALVGIQITSGTQFVAGITGECSCAGIEKFGAGTLILNGNSSLLGGSLISEGRLQIGTTTNTTPTFTGDLFVTGTGEVGGTGTVDGMLFFGGGGSLAPGASIGTLTTGTVLLDFDSTLNFEFGAPGISDRVDVNGDLVLDGTLNVIDAGGFGAGVYRIFNYTGTFLDNGLDIGTIPGGSLSDYAVQTSIANQVNLIFSGSLSPIQFWRGGSGTWSATSSMFTDMNGAGSASLPAGGFPIFQTGPGVVTIDHSAGQINVTGMQFAASGFELAGGALTLNDLTTIRVGDGSAAGAGMIATISAPLIGSGGVRKTDFGTLVLSGNNSYTGSTVIDSGTLRLGSATALGQTSGLLIESAGTLDLNGFTFRMGSVGGTGAVALGGGTFVLGDGNASSTFAGRITGSGTFRKSGSGNLVLTGVNSHSGETFVEGGTLTVGANGALSSGSSLDLANGAAVDVNGFAVVTGSVSGGGTIYLGSGSLTNAGNASTTFGGEITGGGSIIKAGSGTWTLTGSNSYRGATIVSNGTLRVGSGRALGDTSSVAVNGGGTLDLNSFDHAFTTIGGTGRVELGSATLTLGGDDTLVTAVSISGSGRLNKAGNGVLALRGVNTYTGGTFITSGVLLGDTSSLQGAIANNAVVAFDQQADGLFTGAISGTGQLVKQGAGTLTLAGANTFSGGIFNFAGSLLGSTQSLSGTIVNNASLGFTQSVNGVFNGVLGGTGSMTKRGAGALTLTGAHPMAGATTVAEGTLILDGTLGGAVNVQPGATFLARGALGGSLTVAGQTQISAADEARDDTFVPNARPAWATAAADVQGSVGALGQLFVAGDISFGAGSVLQVATSAAGQSQLLSASGAISMAGTELLLTSGSGAFPRVMQTALMSATGGVRGTPSVAINSGALEPFVSTDGQTLFLTVINHDAAFETSAATPNSRRLAAAFDRTKRGATGDLRAVARELAGLDDLHFEAALAQAQGQIHASVMQLAAIDAEAAADRIRREVGQRRTAAGFENASNAGGVWGTRRRFWGAMTGELASMDASADIQGARGHVGGFALGMDWAPGSAWLLGAGGGYSIGELTLDGGEQADSMAPRAFAYAGYGQGRFTAQGGATIARQGYESRRSLAFTARLDPRFGSQPIFGGIDREASLETHGIETGAWTTAALRFPAGGWSLEPGAAFRAARYGRGGWQEGGANALSLSAPEQSVTSMQADLNLSVARTRGRLRAYGSATYRRELGDAQSTLTLQLTQSPEGLFTIDGLPLATNRGIATIGMNAGERVSFGYRVETGSGQLRHAIDVGVRFQ